MLPLMDLVPIGGARGCPTPCPLGAFASLRWPRLGVEVSLEVLPFLLHNLDTGETSVMEKAWVHLQSGSADHSQSHTRLLPSDLKVTRAQY